MEAKEVKIQLKNIELLSKSMMQFNEPNIGQEFQFDIKTEIKVNAQQKLALAIAEINTREFQKEIVLSTISVACFFQIENFEDVITLNENGLYDIPLHTDNLMKAVCISTVRGIMFSEFRGTYLQGAILPIILLQQPPDQEKAK